MSRNPGVKDDLMECPLCMEPLEIDDVNFFPCTCGYQICRFCWHRIRTDENGLCPACRKPYPEDPAVYKPLSQEELQRIKTEKKQKQNEKKQKITENRKHLASVRVVQRNLVFVVGLSQRLADPEVLRRPEYFGKFGKIHKVVINNSTSYAGSQGPSASAYVTYIRSEDALRAIQCVNNVVVDGRTLKASLGTTKYCSYFLKSMQCPKPDCMYLHELGDEAASFTKEEMQAGKHQEYEQKLLQDLYKSNPTFLQSPAVSGDRPKGKGNSLQSSSKDGLSSDPGRSPPSEGSDCEHLTPAGPQPDPGLDPVPALCPFSSQLASPSHTLTDIISIGNGETSQLLRGGSESPSPPPGLSKPSLLLPISVPGHTAHSPFEAAPAESQSLFSDNSNFRHPNPLPSGLSGFPSSPHSHADWPTAPEPQSLFTSDTMPVSSSTDWQAAFGFGSSNQQQEDDLGFDPFDITRRALADLIEKELSVEDSFGSAHRTLGPLGGLPPSQHFPQHQHPRRADYSSVSFPSHPPSSASSASCGSWMASTSSRRNFVHLNHTVSVTAFPSHSSFLDLTVLPGHHSTGLGGIPITESSSCGEGLNMKEWQDGLRALLPNININFGGLPNSSSSSLSSSSSSSSVQHAGAPGLPHSLCWDRTARWMDPAIITGIPTSAGNGLDSLQDDNPPHWLKSLQTLTEMDAPSSSVSQNGSLGSQPPPHRAGWAHYPAPSSQFHSPPPGFQTAFRPPTQTQTDLLQSAAINRH
ncbi:CCR4-NOT transcription complex subunit 4 isoform X1 [Sander lucioperca]|uniref:CCR4-NOT transcription complex subunit 4 isoform X1 n=1 Tax=Sander lucioperca TaxID=283035 RepID=UPI001653E201|nr:CCR4-NOT transcription complex subunit 4 isoform X1 [Sander lucioperca]XP_031144110.2 CCR4-NOT transcription complex subunit 4 isoform X1 [Sander lucioperca]XP_035851904.1 CCR4-NOT transcription complex subunit 4 isoform X1 [Sander lucioperca]